MKDLLNEFETLVKNLMKIDRPDTSSKYSVLLVQIEKMKLQLASSGNKKVVKFTYTNHRGETRVRTVEPIDLRFGDTPYHDGEQWFLEAKDKEKNVTREFAMKDIRNWKEDGT